MSIARDNRAKHLRAKGGTADVWYYRDPGSLHVYVRPLDPNKKPLLQEPISFRLYLEQPKEKLFNKKPVQRE